MSTEAEGLARDIAQPTIKRRHVIYVQGYDPRGLAEYYRLFRSEYRKFCALYGFTGKVGKIVNPDDRFTTTWNLDTQGPLYGGQMWHVDTTYEFLRWEDIIREDFARPSWWKTLHAFRGFATTLFNGVYARIWRAHWRFAVFIFYPFFIFALNMLLAGLAGGIARAFVALLAPPAFAWLVGIAVFVTAFVMIVRRTESLSYMLYLFDDIASTNQFLQGERRDWEQRFEVFAGYLIDAARNTAANEIVVVGHSSGSFVAVEVIGRALARDPRFADGKNLRLLTIGANLPIIGFNPHAHAFRTRMKAIADSSIAQGRDEFLPVRSDRRARPATGAPA